MTNYHYLYVDKLSGTFSDTLVAFGLARLLYELLGLQETESEIDVGIVDEGGFYGIACNPPLSPETVKTYSSSLWPMDALKTETTAAKLPEGVPCFDYAREKEITKNYRNSKNREGMETPHPYFSIFSAINSKEFSARDTYNKVVGNWHQVRTVHEIMLLTLNCFSTSPNDIEQAENAWDELKRQYQWSVDNNATCLQLYNPTTGKGAGGTKPTSTQPSPRKQFWIVEWLKAIGLFECGIVGYINKDYKVFALAPTKVSFEIAQKTTREFGPRVFAATSVGFDVLAVLHYTSLLLEHSIEEINEIAQEAGIWVPSNVIAGFSTAFYKNLEAAATMNISFIALPEWIRVANIDEVEDYSVILDDLRRIARHLDSQFRDNKPSYRSSDDVLRLLVQLREFVSGGNLRAFLSFAVSYGTYYLSARERGASVYPIKTELVERIVAVMGKKLSALKDRAQYPGLHNIAAAIAESTVWAQYRKLKSDNKTFEVRYGLQRDLARNAHEPSKFLKALATFIHTYNTETMRAKELGLKPERQMIDPSDLDDVIQALDDYEDSALVAGVMLAYGSGFMRFSQTEVSER